MRIYILLLSALLLVNPAVQAQNDSPYKTSTKVDLPIIVTGMGLTYYGLTRMQAKPGISEAEAEAMRTSDVNGFDRFSAGYYSESANHYSDFPFYASFAAPFLLALDGNVKSKAGQVFALYVETMAVTGTLFTMTNGHVKRNRPLTYSPDVSLAEKARANSQNSFYAGHTAASASAAFFAAKIFHDFNPDSPARPYIWATAAAIPATVGYFRLKAGKHFLSDNILGYVMGATAGILVPQLHKKSNKRDISIVPVMTPEYEGAALTMTF